MTGEASHFAINAVRRKKTISQGANDAIRSTVSPTMKTAYTMTCVFGVVTIPVMTIRTAAPLFARHATMDQVIGRHAFVAP